MAERLLGIETEYALGTTDARGGRVEQGRDLDVLMRNARRRLPYLPDELGRGMFLASGARFYVDCGGHPEVTTPECSNPWDVVRHVRAGESLLLQLADGRRTAFFRSNVDHSGSQATWGNHENFSHRVAREQLPKQIVPHLVSRLVFTGAGGFDNLSGGIDFTLSPRTPHLSREISTDSTSNRGIFHDKGEDLSSNSRRLHILCGESLCSDLALWLRAGTTALVVALCEAGLRPGDGVELRDPLAAMRGFAADPSCRATAETTSGAHLTAIAIQRHYLTMAETHVAAPFMPSWAAEVCRRWRAMLDRLEDGWEAVATTLDWAIKLGLYRDHVRRRGSTWEALAAWSPVITKLCAALARTARRHEPLTAALVFDRAGPIADEVERLRLTVTRMDRTWQELEPILEIRHELFEIDTRFGQLGERGIFTGLDAAGVLTHRLPGIDPGTRGADDLSDVPRARLRGQLVRELSGSGSRYCCTWQGVWDCEHGTFVDLSDPFAVRPEWRQWSLGDDPMPPERFVAAWERSSAAPEARRRRAEAVAEARANANTSDPIALSNRALALRQRDQLDGAERLLREAIAIEDAQVPADSPKRPHRRNNLTLVLLRAAKLEDASAFNVEAWSLKAGQHDVTSGRILFARVALRLLLGDRHVLPYLGQLKTLFAEDPLPCLGDVTSTWDIPDVLATLSEHLDADDADLLIDVAETLNDRTHLPALDAYELWAAARRVPLTQPWPRQIAPSPTAVDSHS